MMWTTACRRRMTPCLEGEHKGMMGRLTAILGFCLVVFAPSQSAWAMAPLKGGHLTICQAAEPPGLDPTAGTEAAIDRVTYTNLFEGLVKVDRTGALVPGLASGWEVTEAGRRYRFELRKGVSFHDGSPFNASVARWNLEQAMGMATVNPHPEYFRGIAAMDTPDAHTLVIDLKDIDALFLTHLAEGDAVMLPKGDRSVAKTHPVGTGPFRFVKWVHGDRVELARFNEYWNPQLPYLDTVSFKFIGDAAAQLAALKSGQIDVIGSIAAPESAFSLSKDERFKVFSGTTTGEVILSTNNKVAPFNNKLVRQAMAHAIDRQVVVDLVMFGYGTPIGSHWSPGTPYYQDLTGMFPYDPTRAKELLAQAGFADGFTATIKLPAIYSYSRRAGEVVADMLSKVGITLKMEFIEWGQWIERIYKNKEYQLTMIGHVEAWDIGIYANPDYYFQYDSEEFRNAYSHAIKAPDETTKAKWFAECQRIIAADAVNGYMFSFPSLAVMKASVMNWWPDYPTVALDCSEVWLKP